MLKVTAEEFMKVICDLKLDTISEITGNYPYKHTFKLRHGEVVGYQYGGYFINESFWERWKKSERN